MKKSTIIYVTTVSVFGLLAGIWMTWQFISNFNIANLKLTIILALLLILCRCLPLDVNEDCTIDMSFISILTIFLLCGYQTAGSLYIITTPFVFVSDSTNKKNHISIYNTAPIKSLFNVSNIILSIFGSGICYSLTGGVAGYTALPGCLLPIFAYIFVSMAINTLLMSLLLYFEMNVKISSTLVSGFMQFIPNILCAAPIGYFLARIYQFNDGPWLMFLFILPLLLARYSFKNYLEVRHQQYVLINALSAAIEAKDGYTVGHSKRVEQYSELMARKMKLSKEHIYNLQIEALFHDIGKIGINDSILNKPAKLTPEEMKTIQQHPAISARILKDIDFYGNIQGPILHHHERYDGSGYPDGIKGKDIEQDAAIIAVADAFDAMTSDRPYRKGYSQEKAIEIIKEESGHQFDPQAADAMIKLYESGALADFN